MIVPESTFTGARAFCPRPDRWHSPDIQATEVEVSELVAALVTACRPERVLETGTYKGHTAAEIGRALRRAGFGHLTTIERDPVLADEARGRCFGLPVEVVTGDTLGFVPGWPVDFAWFDSGDSIRGEEFRHFYPYMHEKTIVGFHDVGPQHKVWAQVRELVADGVLAGPLLLYTPRGVCFANVAIREGNGIDAYLGMRSDSTPRR